MNNNNEPAPPSSGIDIRRLLQQHAIGLLALFSFVALYPVKYHKIFYNFDSYWIAALNYLHFTGKLVGRDTHFTYGPLAWLVLPMPIGNNLTYGILFQLAAWLILGAVLVWLVFRENISPLNWLVLAICAPAGAQLFRASPTDGPDYFLEVLVAMLAAFSETGPVILYAAAVAIAATLLLIKLSTGIAAVSIVLLFPAALALRDKLRALRLIAIGAVGIPAVLVTLFWVLGGTPKDLWMYFRAGFEFSSGYNAAMSQEGPQDALYAALLILAGFLTLAIVLYLKKSRAFPIACAMLPALFFEYKHSFVRQDGHVENVFKLAPLVLAIILLAADLRFQGWRLRAKGIALAAGLLIAAPWLYFERGHYYFHEFPWEQSSSPFSAVARIGELADLGALATVLQEAEQPVLDEARLPQSLRDMIGRNPVASPEGNAVAAMASDVRFIPFPLLDAFSAYTPTLDAWNAEFVRNSKRPELILFQWITVDERHPLLDCPQTALALYQNYQFEGIAGDAMVLSARSHQLPTTLHFVRETTMNLGEPLPLSGVHDSVIQIFLEHNLRGRLGEIFFRVPPIYATLSGGGGKVNENRISPAVLAGGVALKLLPSDFEDARRLFETGHTAADFDTITLSGPGIADFARTAKVKIYDWEHMLTMR